MLAFFFTIADWLKQASVFYPADCDWRELDRRLLPGHGPDSFVRQSIKIHVGDKPFNLLGDVPELRQTLIGVVTLSILWLILCGCIAEKSSCESDSLIPIVGNTWLSKSNDGLLIAAARRIRWRSSTVAVGSQTRSEIRVGSRSQQLSSAGVAPSACLPPKPALVGLFAFELF